MNARGVSFSIDQIRSSLRIFLRLVPYARSHATSLGAAGFLTMLIVLTDLARPWPIKVVIDQVILGQPWAALPAWLTADRSRLLLVACMTLLVLAALGGALTYLRTTLLARSGQEVVNRLRRDVYARLLQLSLRYHDRHPRGDLLVRLTGDVSLIRMLVIEGAFLIGQEVVTLLGVLVVMLLVHAGLTLVAAVTVPVVATLVIYFGGRLKAAARKQRQKEGQIANTAAEALMSVPVIQAYGLEEEANEAFRRHNKRSRKAALRAARLEASMSRWTEIAIAAGAATLLGLGGQQVLQGRLSAGELIVLISYVRTLYKPLRKLSASSAKIFKSAAGGERIVEVLDEEIDLRSPEVIGDIPAGAGHLAFVGVEYGFDGSQQVLRGIDLEVRAGEHVGVLGPNGAGKSTLVSLIPRLRDPDLGQVLLDGRDVREFELSELRRRCTVLFQQPVLFDGTIEENVRMGDGEADSARAEGAMEIAGVFEFASLLPQGVQTRVGEGGTSLSGGQRQRVAIARALVRRPTVIILDEPTTSLDDETVRQLIERVLPALRGRTVICVTHDARLLGAMDRLIFLDRGRIVRVAEGSGLQSAEELPLGVQAAIRPVRNVS